MTDKTYTRAYNYCLYILSKRDYSEFQLRRKLKEKGYEEFTEEVVSKLHEHKYIQEDEYRRSRIKALIHKGYSAYYISQKLESEHLGTTKEFIEDIYQELQTSEQEQKQHLIQKKLRALDPKHEKTKEKIIRFLISKGHRASFSEIDLTEI